jgi:hypothetical protein
VCRTSTEADVRLTVQKLNLFFDGYLPRDSMVGDRFREVFSCAKPLIDYAFKVDRTAYVRVWWFDRYLDLVVEKILMGRPRLGRFYTTDFLRSETDREVAAYLEELGYQVRLTLMSIDRQEYMVLVVFSAQGAILEEGEECKLLTLEAKELLPLDDYLLAEPPARWDPRRDLITAAS